MLLSLNERNDPQPISPHEWAEPPILAPAAPARRAAERLGCVRSSLGSHEDAHLPQWSKPAIRRTVKEDMYRIVNGGGPQRDHRPPGTRASNAA
jgi:hypothetical protein